MVSGGEAASAGSVPGQVASLLAQADAYDGADRLAEALETYARALTLEPGNIPALLGVSGVCRQMGRHADAVGAAQQAIALGPERAGSYRVLALALAAAGDLAGARRAAWQAVTLDPGNWRSHWTVAVIDVDHGRITPPIRQAADYARTLAPDSAVVLSLCGTLELKTRHYLRARELFNQALALDPGNRVAKKNLALLDIRQGREGEAVRRLVGVLAGAPSDDWARRNVDAALGGALLRVCGPFAVMEWVCSDRGGMHISDTAARSLLVLPLLLTAAVVFRTGRALLRGGDPVKRLVRDLPRRCPRLAVSAAAGAVALTIGVVELFLPEGLLQGFAIVAALVAAVGAVLAFPRFQRSRR